MHMKNIFDFVGKLSVFGESRLNHESAAPNTNNKSVVEYDAMGVTTSSVRFFKSLACKQQ
jgi:hypothetical protein